MIGLKTPQVGATGATGAAGATGATGATGAAGPNSVTANTTTTSGFTAGQLITSDGTKCQAAAAGTDFQGVISATVTYYVATTGNDTTGNGSVGNPWATLSHALAYLGNYWIASTAVVTISIGNGSYTSDFPTVQHPCGGQISITATNSYQTAITAVSADGATNAVLTLASTANVAANDYVSIFYEDTSTPTKNYLSGCFKVLSVSGSNVTVNSLMTDFAGNYPNFTGLSISIFIHKVRLGTLTIAQGSYLRSLSKIALKKLTLNTGSMVSCSSTVGLTQDNATNVDVLSVAAGSVLTFSTLVMSGADAARVTGGACLSGSNLAATQLVYGLILTNSTLTINSASVFACSKVDDDGGKLLTAIGSMVSLCLTAFCGMYSFFGDGTGTALLATNGSNICATGYTFGNNEIDASPARGTSGNDNAWIN